MVDNKPTQPQLTLPVVFFLSRNGLFYYQQTHRWETCDLLVIPHSKIEMVMHLAHSNPLEDPLGAYNTVEKLWDRFNWTGRDRRSLTLLLEMPSVSMHHSVLAQSVDTAANLYTN